jgi:DNA helicase-2/ATP-dependent DNA helicase PcrA
MRWKDFAILYRTNAQSRSIEEALRRGNIPYRLVGGVSFYQRKEIKDALAYLRLAVNPHDAASFLRAVNEPARGVGDKSISLLRAHAASRGTSLWDAARDPAAGLTGRAATSVRAFVQAIEHAAGRTPTAPADDVARELLQASGLLKALRDENTPESLGRLDNIHELINAVAEYAGAGGERTLADFLQEVSLVADVDTLQDEDNRVTLMTLHASKGLEFKVVFIAGLEEGLFPLSQSATDPSELEEERRLFYVGVTRAERLLFLSHARHRYRFGESEAAVRSRFLDEIETQDVVRTESGGAFQRQAGRYTLDDWASDAPRKHGYGTVDPHYYRRSLTKGSHGPSRPAGSERRVEYDDGYAPLVTGSRVRHETFGEGRVLGVDGVGERATATIFFPSVGQKRLKLKFARLQVIG